MRFGAIHHHSKPKHLGGGLEQIKTRSKGTSVLNGKLIWHTLNKLREFLVLYFEIKILNFRYDFFLYNFKF